MHSVCGLFWLLESSQPHLKPTSLSFSLPLRCPCCASGTKSNQCFPHYRSSPVCQQFSCCFCIQSPLFAKQHKYFVQQVCKRHNGTCVWFCPNSSKCVVVCLCLFLVFQGCCGPWSMRNLLPTSACRWVLYWIGGLRLVTFATKSPVCFMQSAADPNLCHFVFRVLSVPYRKKAIFLIEV